MVPWIRWKVIEDSQARDVSGKVDGIEINGIPLA
jgi:hypothetical protein